MSRFVNAHVGQMESYTPGEQPRDKKYIKLNTNESPYPPSRGVIEAVNREAVEDLRLYSDPTALDLKKAIGGLYGKKPCEVFISNGSDDILNFAFMAYGHLGAVYSDITYGFYKVYAKLHGAVSTVIPLLPDMTQDKSGYIRSGSFVVIANPNAPTGEFIPLCEIEKIVAANKDGVVLVDEAYVDFGGESAVPLTEKYDNLLVVCTYSKSRSMAGARLGFAIGNKELIGDLEKIKYSTNPYNVNRLTLTMGIAAVSDDAYYKENCKKIIKTREYTAKELEKVGFEVLPSKANFIFAKSPDIGGKELYLALKEKGILVRHFDSERIKEYNRITIGSYDEMVQFIKTVKEIIGK